MKAIINEYKVISCVTTTQEECKVDVERNFFGAKIESNKHIFLF